MDLIVTCVYTHTLVYVNMPSTLYGFYSLIVPKRALEILCPILWIMRPEFYGTACVAEAGPRFLVLTQNVFFNVYIIGNKISINHIIELNF